MIMLLIREMIMLLIREMISLTNSDDYVTNQRDD